MNFLLPDECTRLRCFPFTSTASLSSPSSPYLSVPLTVPMLRLGIIYYFILRAATALIIMKKKNFFWEDYPDAVVYLEPLASTGSMALAHTIFAQNHKYIRSFLPTKRMRGT
jgi:hypothetical protein